MEYATLLSREKKSVDWIISRNSFTSQIFKAWCWNIVVLILPNMIFVAVFILLLYYSETSFNLAIYHHLLFSFATNGVTFCQAREMLLKICLNFAEHDFCCSLILLLYYLRPLPIWLYTIIYYLVFPQMAFVEQDKCFEGYNSELQDSSSKHV